MAKKKRLKQLAAKTNGEKVFHEAQDLSGVTANPENNKASQRPVSELTLENISASASTLSFAGDTLSKSDILSTSQMSDKTMPSKSPGEKLPKPRSRHLSAGALEGKSQLSSSVKQKHQKEVVRNKMEQKMNMRLKKIKDPRLIPRMKEYLETRVNKNFVSIPLMADYLQQKYAEYGRKKKSMFVQYVDKAYSYMEKPCNNDPPPPLSDTDEDSNTEKELVTENGRYVWKNVSEHSREMDDDTFEEKADKSFSKDKSDSSDDENDCKGETLIEYKDTNAINNTLMNMYRNSPTHVSKSNPDEKKRKLMESRPCNPKRSKSDSKVMYPSANVLDRNISSAGLVGPCRSQNDKYFIDRKGDNISKTNTEPLEVKDSRDVTIQKFLGNLPSRTSFSSYVSGSKDQSLRSGTLYRVHTGNTDKDPGLVHSGITEENIGTSDNMPLSPSSGALDEAEASFEVNVDPRLKIVGDEARDDLVPKSQYSAVKEKSAQSKKKATTRFKKTSSSRNPDLSEAETDRGPVLQKSTVTFADVGGNEKTLIEICKLLVHMRHPEVYCQLGVTPPRGFLLHGPPGCGKTLLANAIAGELDLPMMKLAATEIVSGVSGDSEEKIRGLFEKASQSAPCVVFIDEIDSITPKRETASKDMERRIVAQLLACMDDLNANPGCHVLVIGATNRPDSLDPALRRAGRFDREICLGIPDQQSRHRILEVLCRNLRLSSQFDFTYLAHNTPGYVGADLMALTREAAMTAVNRVFQSLQSKTAEELLNKTLNNQSDSGNISVTDGSISHGLLETSAGVDLKKTDQSFNNNSMTLVCPSPSELVQVSNRLVYESSQALQSANGQPSHNSNHNLMSWTSKTEQTGLDSVNEIGGSNVESKSNCEVVKDIGDKNVLQTRKSDDEILISEPFSAVTNGDVTVETVKGSDTNHNHVESVYPVTTDKAEAVTAPMDVNIEHEQSVNQKNEMCQSETMTVSEQTKTIIPSNEYISVLKWLKDHPPLTESQLSDLYITMEDFKEALTTVQPSAKREGFATVPDVTWDDIGALRDVREELQLAILAPVRHPEQFKSLGLNRAQGVLLAGPPGCGKTLLAKAIANESGINFISVKGPELLNMYVGESERAVRTVFQRARNSAPCVIFFDELDALCPRRSGNSEGNSSARVVNQLLTEMDGLEDRKQVFIMAATNRPDIIDPAVLRPGRLDKTLYVGLPTSADRLDILKCLTKNGTRPLLDKDVNLQQIAEDERANYFTGADLAALVREASIAALKQVILTTSTGVTSTAPVSVTSRHFTLAFDKVKPSVSVKDQEKYSSMRNRLQIA